uniref:hypothetical protein n=1 Tax=Flavobacterium sp. TaxID=239 RepID=UPI00404864E3
MKTRHLKSILILWSNFLFITFSFAQEVDVSKYNLEQTITFINEKLACCSSNKSIKIAVSEKGILTQNMGNKYAIDLSKTFKIGNSIKYTYDLEYIKFSNNDYRIIYINNEGREGVKLLPFASSFSTEMDAKNVLKALVSLQKDYRFLSSMQGGFEDSGDDTLFNALANYSKNGGALERLLNAEWEKQVESKTKPYKSYKDKIVVQKFKIDDNVLSFSTKEVFENNCYPSDANCEIKGIYSITRQEVALKDIMYIGKDGKVQLLTKGEKDVKWTTKTYSTKGKFLE